jgi:hypothetical protein
VHLLRTPTVLTAATAATAAAATARLRVHSTWTTAASAHYLLRPTTQPRSATSLLLLLLHHTRSASLLLLRWTAVPRRGARAACTRPKITDPRWSHLLSRSALRRHPAVALTYEGKGGRGEECETVRWRG